MGDNMDSSDKYSLTWNDFEKNISSTWQGLRDTKDFCDVTIACDNQKVEAHKIILSSCSPIFRSLLRENTHHHPLLYLRGVKYSELVSMMDFMYRGEVNVTQEDLNDFLAVASDLQVKGLHENEIENEDGNIEEGNMERYDGKAPALSLSTATPTRRKKRIRSSEKNGNTFEVAKNNIPEIKEEVSDDYDCPDFSDPLGGMDETLHTQNDEFGDKVNESETKIVKTVKSFLLPREGNYNCKFCGKTFAVMRTLRRHENIHKGNLYHCELCSKGFTDPWILKRHMLIHYRDSRAKTDQNRYKCQVCGITHLSKEEFESHLCSG